jgi:hypothetical protein
LILNSQESSGFISPLKFPSVPNKKITQAGDNIPMFQGWLIGGLTGICQSDYNRSSYDNSVRYKVALCYEKTSVNLALVSTLKFLISFIGKLQANMSLLGASKLTFSSK